MNIGIVIPCYNHADLLPAAWRSVEAQTVANINVVVVNDRSTDNTQAVIDSLRPRPGINLTTISNKKNFGQSETINRAMAAIDSEYVMVLNDDDYLMHDAVEAASFVIEKSRRVLFGAACMPFSGGWLDTFPGPFTIREKTDYNAIELQLKSPSDIDPHNHESVAMTHTGMVVKHSAWAAVGGYKQPHQRGVKWSDRDFQLRVAKRFGCVMATGTVFSFWRQDRSVDEGRFT